MASYYKLLKTIKMVYFEDACFILDDIIKYMFLWKCIILITFISVMFIMLNLLCILIIMALAYKYEVYDYYDRPPIFHLFYIIACVIPIYRLILWPWLYTTSHNVGLIIACIKDDANLYLFILQRHYLTDSSIIYMVRHESNEVINAILPIMHQNELSYFAEVAFENNKPTLLKLVLPYITNSHDVIENIWSMNHWKESFRRYDIAKIFIEYGLNHNHICYSQTAQFLNDGYHIENKYVNKWHAIRTQRQANISNILNKLPIKHYDVNISAIITSYLPYEYIPNIEPQRAKKARQYKTTRRRHRRH